LKNQHSQSFNNGSISDHWTKGINRELGCTPTDQSKVTEQKRFRGRLHWANQKIILYRR